MGPHYLHSNPEEQTNLMCNHVTSKHLYGKDEQSEVIQTHMFHVSTHLRNMFFNLKLNSGLLYGTNCSNRAWIKKRAHAETKQFEEVLSLQIKSAARQILTDPGLGVGISLL